MPVRLKPTTPRSQVKHSTTELPSKIIIKTNFLWLKSQMLHTKALGIRPLSSGENV